MIWKVAAAVLFVCPALTLHAGTVRYFYDELDRLIGVIDESGILTEYEYDPVGNILSIKRSGTLSAPVPANSTLTDIHRGEARDYRVTGTGFLGATLSSPSAQVTVSGLRVASTEINFTLSASATAPLGPLRLTLSNPQGSATLNLQVLEPIEVAVLPLPLAVPPDNRAYQAQVIQNVAAGADTVIRVVSGDPTIATPGAASVTLPTGQSSTPFTIVGKATGRTQFTLTSSLWASPISVDVIVDPNAARFRGNYAKPVGVVKGSPVVPNAAVPSSPVVARVGVVKGSPISPNGPVPSGPVVGIVGVVKGNPLTPNGPVASAPIVTSVGVVKGSPILPNSSLRSSPVVNAVGVVKGSPVSPNGPLSSGAVPTPPVGLFRGSPVSPNNPLPSSPVMAAPVGISK